MHFSIVEHAANVSKSTHEKLEGREALLTIDH